MDADLRLLFPTQSIGCRLFWRLYRALERRGGVGHCGFLVTNRLEFDRFAGAEPDFDPQAVDLIKEWDLLAAARAVREPDLAAIEAWEKEIGDPTLWHALILDRRLGFPLRAQFVQDYRPAYTHRRLLALLATALDTISAQFDRVRPHAVVGLNAVTVYDYLYMLMARQRGIPYLQLKLTRVENFVSFYTDPFGISPHIAESYASLLRATAPEGEEQAALDEARRFIARARDRRLVYEGAIAVGGGAVPSGRVGSTAKRLGRLIGGLPAKLPDLWAAWSLDDPHYAPPLRHVWESRVVKPVRRRSQRRLFDIADSAAFAREHAGRYALFPLNTEPEVALLGFGRPFRNQIETARLLAAALPVGWTLVVKEHPNSQGYRSGSFYRKLKAIPNVRLVRADAASGPLMDQAGLIAVVYGTIGLEALIRRKPVLILSRPPYDLFPPSMVRYMGDPWEAPTAIRDLLVTHAHDEAALEAFVAAHVATGVRANLFTDLLAKPGREIVAGVGPVVDQYNRLADHARDRISDERLRLGAPVDRVVEG